jgi:hypothetical protein
MPHWMAWDGVKACGFSEHIGSWNALNSIQMDEISAKMADTYTPCNQSINIILLNISASFREIILCVTEV